MKSRLQALGHRFSRALAVLPLRRWRHKAYVTLWLGRLVFWGGAIGVGLLAVLFAELSEFLSHHFVQGATRYWWLPLVLTPLGGALCVWTTRRYFSGAEGSGIPQALAEMQRPADAQGWKPLLSLRIIAGKILVGASAVGCGFSLGREGPTVQVGASLMHAIHGLLPRSLHIQRNHLLVAGGAAGIAAAFNAPLAGIMFAIEEMSRGVEARMSGLIITAIVLAGVTAQALMGGGNYFGNILIIGGDGDQLKAVALSALVCGLAGGLFARLMILGATAWRGPLADFRRDRPVWFAAACGLLVACLGLVTGGVVYGSGLEQTQALLEAEGNIPWYFGPAKFVATLMAYLAGLPGGIFAPALSIGAGLGHDLAPLLGQTAAPGMLLALCMAGFLAAVTQAPITSFVIVMEMVDGYSLVIGLMAVSLLSSGLSRLISAPLYPTLAAGLVARQVPPPAPATRT
ncbi:chloride channel protein [Azovibrio restrictus]|uniref:chloride channel protein n=1 Tax=Azovibrio restrictus TaxID=146938 RepID=UPI0026EE7B9A|nr:chloride channel protein [Azovibrio restrictus]MDD3482108.1 chloride channel protein [Azovibrio restrictus]